MAAMARSAVSRCVPPCVPRGLLLLAALAAAVCSARAQDYEFPADFYFSSATASYQVEGGWNASGKGENIWDHLTHQHPELIADGSNGDVACDSYHKFKEDVHMLRNIGMNMYRFSLSWSRILPTGAIDHINPDGVRYYNELIDELMANGITPMVTLFHWDLPQPLMDIGGWPNEVIADYYEDFAELAFDTFGDRVKHWLTFNEPTEICGGGWGTGDRAPAIHSDGLGDYLCSRTLLLAHARAYHLYNNTFRAKQNGTVGITLYSPYAQPEDSNSVDDINAAERAMLWILGWFANPIFSQDGDYPLTMRQNVDALSAKEGLRRSRIPKFSESEIQTIKGTSDFFGLNHYTTRTATFIAADKAYVRSMKRDGNYTLGHRDTWTPTVASWMWETPFGLRGVLKWIQDSYGSDIPIIITENGCPDDGELKDVQRTRYYRRYMKALLEAIYIDKANVFGYTAWSLMDNYEWFDGYRNNFGIHSVDFNDPDRPRTPKMSAKLFQEVIRTRKVPEANPDFPDDSGTTRRTTAGTRSTAAPARPDNNGAASGGEAALIAVLAALVCGVLGAQLHAN